MLQNVLDGINVFFNATAENLNIFLCDYLYIRPRYNNLNTLILKKDFISNIKNLNLHNFLINPNRFNNVDLLNTSLWNTEALNQVYNIYGIHTLYIYLPTILFIYWFICFFFLGFILSERNRIIWLLLMLFGTGIFLLTGLMWNLYLIKYTKDCFPNSNIINSIPINELTAYMHNSSIFINFIKFKKLYTFGNIFTDYINLLPQYTLKTINFLGISQPFLQYLKLNSIDLQLIYNINNQIFNIKSITNLPKLSVLLPFNNVSINFFSDLNFFGKKSNFTSNSYIYFNKLSEFNCGDLSKVKFNNTTIFWNNNYTNIYNSPLSLRRFKIINERYSTQQKADFFLIFLLSIKGTVNLFSLNSLIIIFIICVGPTLTIICSCIGLNYEVSKFRSLLWIHTKFIKKQKRFNQYKFKYMIKYIYRKFGGSAAMEFTSVEKEPFVKNINSPKNIKEFLNPIFWIKQFRNSIYTRVPTTLIWFSMILGFLAFPSNHPQWRFIAPLLLFFLCFINFKLYLHFPMIKLNLKHLSLISFIQFKALNPLITFKNLFKKISFFYKFLFYIILIIFYFFCFYYFNTLVLYNLNNIAIIQLFFLFLFLIIIFFIRKWVFNFFDYNRYNTLFFYIDIFLFFILIFLLFPFFIILFIKIFNYCFVFNNIKLNIIFIYLFLGFFLYFILYFSILKNTISSHLIIFFYFFYKFLFFIVLFSFWAFIFSYSFFLTISVPLLIIIYFYTKTFYTIFIYLYINKQKNTNLLIFNNLYKYFIFIYFIICNIFIYIFSIYQLNFFIFIILFLINCFFSLILYNLITITKYSNLITFICDILFCIISTFIVLVFVDGSITQAIGHTFFPIASINGYFFLVLWTWSYLRLWKQLCFFKSIEFFFYWSLVLMPLVSVIAFNLKPLYHLHFWDKYSGLLLLFELIPILCKFYNINKFFKILFVFNLFNLKNTIKYNFKYIKSLRTIFYLYICFLFILLNVIIFSCNILFTNLYFILFLCLYLISFCSGCIIVTITSFNRTGSFDDLQGSLSTLRFLKRLFNIFILLSIILLLFYIYLFIFI